MPYTPEHKKFIQSASKLFSSKGFDQVSINDLMKDAGLTRGAFTITLQIKVVGSGLKLCSVWVH